MTAMEVTTITVERTIASDANTIFLIDCLGEGDKQSARIRQEGICDTLMAMFVQDIIHDLSRVYHERCKHRDDWAAVMNKIRDACKKGLRPLVFIDGHGDATRGLAMPSGGFIGWDEYGRDLRAITYAACGQLTVIAAFCHSFAFIEKAAAKVDEKLPFAFYYGYEEVVLTSVVEEETQRIYESLLNDGGKSLNFDALQISSYDEFDHTIRLIAPVVMMRLAPKTLVAKLPQFSKAQLRAKIEKDLAQSGTPLGQLRRPMKEVMNNIPRLATKLIETTMHDTDRRKRFIKRILSELKKARLPA